MLQRFFLIFILIPFLSFGKQINGEIRDFYSNELLAEVSVINIHTNAQAVSSKDGQFDIAAESGQLLEFRKLGYKTTRIRIPEGQIPSFFKVLMRSGIIELPEFNLITRNKRDWSKDSIRYYQLYKNALEFPTLTGLDAIRHPFSALSKRNRQIWAFQKEYNYWEQQKFVDYTFNKQLITSLTSLTGDSLDVFMKRFRPSYEQLRNMNEYSFYNSIKENAYIFRHGPRYIPSHRRSTY